MLIYTSHLSQGKRFVFIHRFAKWRMRRKCIEKALDSLNIRLESRKNIQKEEQERAVKELISGNDVSSLYDFEKRFVAYAHICRSLLGHSTFLVASLVLMKGTSCCVFKEEFKVE